MTEEKKEKDGIILNKSELEKKLEQIRINNTIPKNILSLLKPEPPSCYLAGPSSRDFDFDKDDKTIEATCYLMMNTSKAHNDNDPEDNDPEDNDPSDNDPSDNDPDDNGSDDTEPMCYDMGPYNDPTEW